LHHTVKVKFCLA